MEIQVTPAHYTAMDGTAAKTGGGLVFFHEVVDLDQAATLKEGKPVSRTRIFCKRVTPGDSLLEVDKPMKEEDKLKYPKEWAAFQQKRSQVVSGTPIEMWPMLSTGQVFEFKAMHIFTVEQFCNLSDQHKQKISGYETLRDKARSFLQLAQDASILERKDAALAERDAKISSLEGQIAELRAMITAPRKGGRPKGSKNKVTNAVRRAEMVSGTDPT